MHDLDHGAWDIPELRRLLREVLKENRTFEGFSIKHDFPHLGRRHMLLNARKLAGGDHRPDLILLAIENVTKLVEAEARREILISELSHRVKNMLAMVQSISSQTLQRSGSLDELKTAFEGRLHALGRAHDVLVQQDWGSADSRHGFGTRLIERSIVQQLGGTATPEFRADGLHYEIAFPGQGNGPPRARGSGKALSHGSTT